MIGTTLSHYKILDELGRGGMGIVYKAEDTKLDRTVAIKVLPPHALTNPGDRERFYREAKAAAQLHHPHIASVFEIDEAVPSDAPHGTEPSPFIAMEFVDGGTLKDEIDKGPMKLREAVRIAGQVSEALKLAHSKEIVHRDIKSHNVMLTKTGDAKVLDFGLAKTAQSTMLTRMGSTLGTVAYMSPEQARGDEVDHRTDIWSLGVMLFEMVAGRLPFAGEYEKAVMYGILNEMAPPLTSLRTGIPMGLEWIVSKCLAKDPNERYQACADLIVDLKTVDLSSSGMSRAGSSLSSVSAVQEGGLGVTATKPLSLPVIPAVVGAVVLLLLGILAGKFLLTSEPTASEPIRRITIPLSPARGVISDAISLSEDGRAVAFETPGDDGSRWYVRFLDEDEAKPLVRASGMNSASLSPDARWLAYKEGRSLYRVSTEGGNPELLSDTLGGDTYSTWRSPSEIVITGWGRGQSHASFYVFEDTRFTTYPSDLPANDLDIDHIHHAPDSDVILYSLWDPAAGASEVSVWARELTSGRTIEVARRASRGRYYKDGYVIFQRNGDLHAVSFDLKSFEIGNSFPVLAGVMTYDQGGAVLYDIAQDGTLVYVPGSDVAEDRGASLSVGPGLGDLELVGSRTGALHDPRFSPDGSKIIVHSRDEEVDLWLVDRSLGGTTQRLTDNPGEDETAAWDPDGIHFYYSSDRDGIEYILRSNINNISVRDTLYSTDEHIHIESVSHDGKYVIFMLRSTDTSDDLWMVSTDAPYEAQVLLNSPFVEVSGRLSPDNNWFVYVSDETGSPQIYLQNFPDLNQRRTLTSDGGYSPIWSEDGRSIFYVSGTRLMRMPFENGQPRAAEKVADIGSHLRPTNVHTEYDVLGNGDEFVFIDTGSSERTQELELHAITGLSELLRQRDPERN